MELGALVCRAKGPVCISCPVSKYCQAYKEGKQEIIPQTKKKIIKDIQAVIAIIKKGIIILSKNGLLKVSWQICGNSPNASGCFVSTIFSKPLKKFIAHLPNVAGPW